MEYNDAITKINDLRGRYNAPFSYRDKALIEMLYNEVLGKTFQPTTCQQCYHDAVIEIYCYLKKEKKMAEKRNFALANGAIIHSPNFHNGKIYTNANLTDAVAAEYLEQFPAMVSAFVRVPENFAPNAQKEGAPVKSKATTRKPRKRVERE